MCVCVRSTQLCCVAQARTSIIERSSRSSHATLSTGFGPSLTRRFSSRKPCGGQALRISVTEARLEPCSQTRLRHDPDTVFISLSCLRYWVCTRGRAAPHDAPHIPANQTGKRLTFQKSCEARGCAPFRVTYTHTPLKRQVLSYSRRLCATHRTLLKRNRRSNPSDEPFMCATRPLGLHGLHRTHDQAGGRAQSI